MNNNMHWKIFTDANTPDKAKNALRRVLKFLAIDHSSQEIQPYYKAGFVCSFNTSSSSHKWPEIVLESLSLAQEIGQGWILSGDVQCELDAWSNELKVVGVQNIHLVVGRNE